MAKARIGDLLNWKRRRLEESKVYVIRCGAYVKIGIASHVPSRMQALQASNPHELELVASFEGGYVLERDLHKFFAEYRHRYEWFREEGQLAEWIRDGCLIRQCEPANDGQSGIKAERVLRNDRPAA